ncbi:MAG: hypothetical protein HYT61_03165 [Candidatus Yanofskybacteria bacterium]|nr:hypothetical protein [Candidatus Yanofskybacteria bacterium]
MSVFIFFPALFAEQKNESTTYLPDLKLKLDKPLMLDKETDSANLIFVMKNKVSKNLALMTDLLAEQELRLWGETKSRETWRYEVAIYNNRQVFRKIEPGGKFGKERFALPIPGIGVRPGQEWHDLFKHLVTTPVSYQGVSSYKGKIVQVFSYKAFSQDKVCHYTERNSFFSNWDGAVGCSGRVVVDEQFNVLQIFQELYLPEGLLSSTLFISVNYEFVGLGENQELLRLPVSIEMAAQFNRDRKWYFASGMWKNYRRFRAKSDVIFPQVESNITYPK